MARLPRRRFLTNAAAGAAAIVSAPAAAHAQQQQADPPPADVYTTDRPGSDFMVDVLKSLGFEYVAANPGSTFRGLHESFINYGGNTTPELLTCCHEESSVAMAHGYAKIEGKPMMVMAHGTVGLQHASMAIYNAYADRVPVYIVLGNIADVAWRRSDVEWTHAVQDAAAMVRDYTKWDDAPVSLGTLRRIGRARVQDRDDAAVRPGRHRRRRGACRKSRSRRRTAADCACPEAVADLAARRRLRRRRRAGAHARRRREPGHRRRTRGADAERDRRCSSSSPNCCRRRCNDGQFTLRMNFPTRHPLNGAGVIADADVVARPRGARTSPWRRTRMTPVNRIGHGVARRRRRRARSSSTISSSDLLTKSNYQDSGRYTEVDLAIAGGSPKRRCRR